MTKEKKRVIKKISNKLFYTLIVFGAIILLGAGVYATVAPGVSGGWDAGEIANPGHTIQDVAAPSGCATGEYLKYATDPAPDTGHWDCDTPSSSIACSSCDSRFTQDGDSLTSPNGIGTFKEIWADDICDKTGGGCGASVRDMEIVNKTSNVKYLTIDCPSGKKVIGGGCFSGKTGMNIAANFPLDSNTWRCDLSEANSANTIYAICAYIN